MGKNLAKFAYRDR